MLQGFPAGHTEVEPAQDEAAQVQASMVAAVLPAINQNATTAADIAACAFAQDWLASIFTHVTSGVDKPAEHAGEKGTAHS